MAGGKASVCARFPSVATCGGVLELMPPFHEKFWPALDDATLEVDGSRERDCSGESWVEDGARLVVRGGGVLAPVTKLPITFDLLPSNSSTPAPTAPVVPDGFEEVDADGWTLNRDPLPGEPCSCIALSSSDVNA